jgi:hypothetical protein
LRLAGVLLLSGLILLAHEPFKTIDRRGKGEAYANSFAAGGTSFRLVILLVHGDDPATLKNAKEVMNQVFQSGRHRVSLVIGDGKSQIWDIFAHGHHAKSVDADDSSGASLGTAGLSAVKAIEEIYDEKK